MHEEIKKKKSLLEQIMDEMFQHISNEKELDADTIKALKDLADDMKFSHSSHVMRVLKPAQGKQHETH